MDHPRGYSGVGGMSLGSPFGAPLATHRKIVLFSCSVSPRSLRNVPWGASACQGGMSPSAILSRMSLGRGRKSSYASNDIGPISPGRWHDVQFLNRIGATSFV